MNRERGEAIYGAFVSILRIPAQLPICLLCATKEAASVNNIMWVQRINRVLERCT